MSVDDEFVAQLRAEWEIRRVIQRYIRANDRLQLDELAAQYHPDAYDDHGSYKGDIPGLIVWIAERHRTIEQSMHLTANPMIELAGDQADVETYCVLVQHERTGCIDLATRLPAYCRYLFGVRYVDRFARREGIWKIAHRTVVWEWSQQEAGTLAMDPRWTLARRDRDDAVYRSL